MIRGYKLCRSVHHGGRRWIPVHCFHAQARDEDGVAIRLQSTCVTCSTRTRRARDGINRLDREPLQEVLANHGYVPKAYGIKSLAKASGVNERVISRIINEEQDVVSIDTADRLLIALGSHLALVYPEQ